MLKKTIKYTDFNGTEREEDFFFNLSKAEIMDMEMGSIGGLAEMIATLIKSQNMPEIIKIFKDIIIKSCGIKSLDGKRFIKTDENGRSVGLNFSETEAFSNLYMELIGDSKKAAEFVNGIIPSDLEVDEEKQKEVMKELFGTTGYPDGTAAANIQETNNESVPTNPVDVNNTQN